MTKGAWRQVRKSGEPFWKLEVDTAYAEMFAIRYLMWLNKHYGHGDWERVTMMYNAGPNNVNYAYLNIVKIGSGL